MFNIKLGFCILKDQLSYGEKWFWPNITGDGAVDLLASYNINGAFVIRPSDKFSKNHDDARQHIYTLCFYLNEIVYKVAIYTKIENFNILYLIKDQEFISLKNLVEYYMENPIYMNQTLNIPAESQYEYIIEGTGNYESFEENNKVKETSNILSKQVENLKLEYVKCETKDDQVFLIKSEANILYEGYGPRDQVDHFFNVFYRKYHLRLNKPSIEVMTEESKLKIHPDFSKLINYCQSVKFDINGKSHKRSFKTGQLKFNFVLI